MAWTRLVALVLMVAASIVPGTAAAAPGEQVLACRFTLGFQALHELIPRQVGDCTDDEGHNSDNGDGLQHTTAWHGKGGLLVWRKGDNWTAFTDGGTTWINGPSGVQSRPNAGPLFPWESRIVGFEDIYIKPFSATPTPVRPAIVGIEDIYIKPFIATPTPVLRAIVGHEDIYIRPNSATPTPVSRRIIGHEDIILAAPPAPPTATATLQRVPSP